MNINTGFGRFSFRFMLILFSILASGLGGVVLWLVNWGDGAAASSVPNDGFFWPSPSAPGCWAAGAPSADYGLIFGCEVPLVVIVDGVVLEGTVPGMYNDACWGVPSGWTSCYGWAGAWNGCTEHCVAIAWNANNLILESSLQYTFGVFGSSRVGPGDPDKSNFEDVIDTRVSNEICIDSSADLNIGNVNHSQQVGPLLFSYNSLDCTSGPLGTGWTHDFNVSIILNSDGSMYLRRSDGGRLWFSPVGNVYYPDSKSGDTSTIVKNSDGSFTRTTKYGKIYNFNSSGQLTSVIDRNGNTTTLTYRGSNLTGITDSTGRTICLGLSNGMITTVTDFAGNVYNVSYNSPGLLSSIADPLGNTWNFQYDSNNRMVLKTDPSGNPVSYVYNSTTGTLTSSTDPNGKAISIVYNSSGVSTVTEKDGGVWVHQYDPVYNVPLKTTDPYGNNTTYAYDSNYNLLSITYPDGTSKSYTYDGNGNVLSVTDAGGRTTTLTYNSQNRVTSVRDPTGGTTTVTYDARGNLATYEDPTGAITQFQRDSKGNIRSVTDPLNHTTQYGYDQYNNVTSVTDPTNLTISLARDIPGNVLSLTDVLNNTTSFAYDADNRLTAAVDPLGNAISLTYDKNGNSNSVTDPLQNPTTYTYDYRGRPRQKVDALGKITTFSYVATGCPSCGGGGEKLTSLTDAVGSITNFAYDLRGLLTSITDPLQKITNLSYDVNGRPSTKTDRNGNTLKYGYTATGKLSSITYPDQSQVTYSYDNLDRLTGMQDSLGPSSFSYDGDGRITSFIDADGFGLSYVYDAAGNMIQVAYPDGSLVTYAYDAANRLTTVTDWLSEQATYVYDGDGRLQTFTQFNGIQATYTYDAASRPTGMASSIASYQFALDGNGNRVQSAESQPIAPTAYNGVSAVYTYNTAKDRLLSAGLLSYSYDNEGQIASAGSTTLTFDYNHRVTAVGSDTTFSYDGRGRRLIATRSGVTTLYIYDPWGNLVAEADSSKNITRKYIYGKGLVAMATSAGRYCYHFDGTGSTVAITDMNGNIVNSYAYEPFGAIVSQQETIAQPFKFVGQYGIMAEPSGLYYMRARYYDPSVGRFISEDPIGFGGGDVNLYAYVLNSPVEWIDPRGLEVDEPFDGEAVPGGIHGLVGGGGSGLGGEAPVPAGSFSIRVWTGYPEGLPMPGGPFRIVEGPEYQAARDAANQANSAMHAADPCLAGKQIHEIHPVKFGGDPVDPANKIALDQLQHSTLTNWWNELLRYLQNL